MKTDDFKSIIVLCTLLFITGCGSVTIGTNTAPIVIHPPLPMDANLANLAPDGYQQYSWYDIKTAKTSPLFEAAKIFAVDETFLQLKKDIKVDPLEVIDEVLLISGHTPGQQKDGFVAVVKGTFQSEKIVQSILSSGGTPHKLEGNILAAKKSKLVVLPVTAKTLAIGTADAIPYVAAIINGTAPEDGVGSSITGNKKFSDFHLNKNDVAVIQYSRPPTGIDKRVFAGTPLGGFSWVEEMQSFTARIDIKDGGLHGIGNLALLASNTANRASRDVKNLINRTLGNPFLALLRLGWLQDRFAIQSNGNELHVRIRLNDNDVRELQSAIDPFLKIRNMIFDKK